MITVDMTRLMTINKIDEKPTISIRSELYEDIRRDAEDKFFNIKDHIEGILYRHLKRNKMISSIWPDLQIAMVKKNAIGVINLKDRKFYDVQLRGNFLFCKQDRSTGCTHSAFVWMQAEDLKLNSKF